MTEPIPDPYSPTWIDGPPHAAEDTAYILTLHRQEQECEVADAHRLVVLKRDRDRDIQLASIVLLGAAAGGARVGERLGRLVAAEEGWRVFIDSALWLLRLLGREHSDEIGDFLDRMRRAVEGER